jgi:hypothetical protein
MTECAVCLTNAVCKRTPVRLRNGDVVEARLCAECRVKVLIRNDKLKAATETRACVGATQA